MCTLVIALAVHQLLEGLALGSVVAAANFGKFSGEFVMLVLLVKFDVVGKKRESIRALPEPCTPIASITANMCTQRPIWLVHASKAGKVNSVMISGTCVCRHVHGRDVQFNHANR